jgi:hypothetical protein
MISLIAGNVRSLIINYAFVAGCFLSEIAKEALQGAIQYIKLCVELL